MLVIVIVVLGVCIPEALFSKDNTGWYFHASYSYQNETFYTVSNSSSNNCSRNATSFQYTVQPDNNATDRDPLNHALLTKFPNLHAGEVITLGVIRYCKDEKDNWDHYFLIASLASAALFVLGAGLMALFAFCSDKDADMEPASRYCILTFFFLTRIGMLLALLATLGILVFGLSIRFDNAFDILAVVGLCVAVVGAGWVGCCTFQTRIFPRSMVISDRSVNEEAGRREGVIYCMKWPCCEDDPYEDYHRLQEPSMTVFE